MHKNIHHTFHFSCQPEAIIHALTDADSIRNWWTEDAVMNGKKLSVKWNGYGWAVELDVERNAQNVVWKCTQSNMQNTPAWEGSTMQFTLFPDSYGTRMEFEHSGYADSPCYDACFAGWHHFLGGSLKAYLEQGKGMPYREKEWPLH